MHEPDEKRSEFDQYAELKELLAASSEYLSVSRDLRPIIIESAKLDQQADARRQRVTLFFAACLLIVTCSCWLQAPSWLRTDFSPTIVCFDGVALSDAGSRDLTDAARDTNGVRTSRKLRHLAGALNKTHPDWGMVETFCEIQAHRSRKFNLSR